jgi:hypothetical protein
MASLAPCVDFVTLGDDVHHIILDELIETSPRSLGSLARVCKALNGVVTPYVYRTVVLGTQKGGELLLRRLTVDEEEGGGIAKWIWHIKVEEAVGAEDLVGVLGRVKNLKSFR